MLCGLSIDNIDNRYNRMAVVRLRELLADEDNTESNDETENENDDENEEFEQPPASSEEPSVDPQGDDTRFHGFGSTAR